MPELPEVETVRAGLERNILGKKIKSVKQLHPRALRSDSLHTLQIFKGCKVKAVRRRGKFMWLEFDRPEVLVAHLGMSGQFKIQSAKVEREPHLRACFTLSNGKELRFIDQRTFGWLAVDRPGRVKRPTRGSGQVVAHAATNTVRARWTPPSRAAPSMSDVPTRSRSALVRRHAYRPERPIICKISWDSTSSTPR